MLHVVKINNNMNENTIKPTIDFGCKFIKQGR